MTTGSIARTALAATLTAWAAGCMNTPDLGPAAPPGSATPEPDLAKIVGLEPFATGLSQPVAIAHAPGDAARRLFVAEKTGAVRVVSPTGSLQPEPYLSLKGKVTSGFEQGLLGIAFHPRFLENRRFFVNYTDTAGDTRVVEYAAPSAGAAAADPAPVREWLFLDQPFANHNGGHLAFGPDGKLYIGTGDGGSGNDPRGNAQNPQSLFGKMLRLDVDAAPAAPAIVAKGLRNPWRYAFDRKSGDVYIGDVGQNSWEEVDVLPMSRLEDANFGWAVVEGDGHCVKATTCDASGFVRPVLEYPTGESGGCSVVAGYPYRGEAMPELHGVFFYSDYCTAFIRSFRWDASAAVDRRDWTQGLAGGKKLESVTTFGEDEDGELYLASQEGTVFKFVRKPS